MRYDPRWGNKFGGLDVCDTVVNQQCIEDNPAFRANGNVSTDLNKSVTGARLRSSSLLQYQGSVLVCRRQRVPPGLAFQLPGQERREERRGKRRGEEWRGERRGVERRKEERREEEKRLLHNSLSKTSLTARPAVAVVTSHPQEDAHKAHCHGHARTAHTHTHLHAHTKIHLIEIMLPI